MGSTVLLATDTMLMGSALNELLGATDDLTVVSQAHDCTAAVAEARRLNPDIAIVSADLGGTGRGLGACTQIITDESLRTLVLVLSNSEREEHLLAALQAGALGYVTPRGTLADLLKDIHGVLRGEACVPGRMLGAILRGLVARERRGADLLERYADLSRRERQILGLLARGQDHDAIATTLVISPETARTHIQNVLTKLGVHSRIEAAALAVEHGWVSPDPGADVR